MRTIQKDRPSKRIIWPSTSISAPSVKHSKAVSTTLDSLEVAVEPRCWGLPQEGLVRTVAFWYPIISHWFPFYQHICQFNHLCWQHKSQIFSVQSTIVADFDHPKSHKIPLCWMVHQVLQEATEPEKLWCGLGGWSAGPYQGYSLLAERWLEQIGDIMAICLSGYDGNFLCDIHLALSGNGFFFTKNDSTR